MSKKKSRRVVYRVKPRRGRWILSSPGLRKFFDTKAEAVALGRAIARSMWEDMGNLSQLVIHKADGKIQTEHTYGADPRRSKG